MKFLMSQINKMTDKLTGENLVELARIGVDAITKILTTPRIKSK